MARPRRQLPAGRGMLLDRLTERAALGRLLETVRGGRRAVLMVYGEVGVGKTALLDHTVAAAAGMRVARVAGIESEMELADAALDSSPARRVDLPRAFRTADLWLIHAADCCSRYSLWTCCGVRY